MRAFLFVAASPHLPTACFAGKANVSILFFSEPSVDAPDGMVLVHVDGLLTYATRYAHACHMRGGSRAILLITPARRGSDAKGTYKVHVCAICYVLYAYCGPR